jgi:hypothetical protein
MHVGRYGSSPVQVVFKGLFIARSRAVQFTIQVEGQAVQVGIHNLTAGNN